MKNVLYALKKLMEIFFANWEGLQVFFPLMILSEEFL